MPKTWDMEITRNSNERTPLLENGVASNGHRQLIRTHATFNQQIPPQGSGVIFSEQALPTRQGAVSNFNTSQVNFPPPGNFDLEPNEVSLEEVVQALFSAWRGIRRFKDVTLNFFSTRELYAMHLAWNNVTRGRHCYSENYRIAEAVAAAIASERDPEPPSDDESLLNSWNLSFYAEKDLIAVNLLREWERITEGVGFPSRHVQPIFEDSEEQPPGVSESWLRQVELYIKIHDFILNSRLQIFLHSLLIIWPLSILIIGYKYLDCPTSYHLSYLLMILGVIGCLATFIRLALIHVTSQDPDQWVLEWIGFRIVEFTFLIVFIIQAFHVFETDSATEPDPNRCVVDFYSTALRINYVSIAFLSAYASELYRLDNL
ncbi:hypothetical protein HNY73_015701 [Argiope bruennichi]|uniref:Uncharacterized protein n=1 Tax=Argiope bruennichi TaxID=94029 RepID=A0A8T0EL96_ARGBR|nr:hypothetical protein HNY73_015701 [Argiope bruennichi]